MAAYEPKVSIETTRPGVASRRSSARDRPKSFALFSSSSGGPAALPETRSRLLDDPGKPFRARKALGNDQIALPQAKGSEP